MMGRILIKLVFILAMYSDLLIDMLYILRFVYISVPQNRVESCQ